LCFLLKSIGTLYNESKKTMTPKQWKRLFARGTLWGGIIVAAVLVVLLAQTTWHVYGTEREARQAHMAEQEALDELTARQKALSEEIDSLGSPRGMEAEVRQRYPVAKSGEEVIILTDPQKTASTSVSATSTSWWNTFLSWF
jgi:cell division protein FtsB